MKRLALLTAALLISTAAMAAEPTPPAAPPPFEPIVLDQASLKAITDYLGGLTYNQAAPIMNFLAQKEAEAQQKAAKK